MKQYILCQYVICLASLCDKVCKSYSFLNVNCFLTTHTICKALQHSTVKSGGKSSDMYTWIFICPIGAMFHFMYNVQNGRGSWMPLFKYPLVQAEELLHGRWRQTVMDILGLRPHKVSLLSQKLSECFLRGEYSIFQTQL